MISIYCSYYRDENFDMLMTEKLEGGEGVTDDTHKIVETTDPESGEVTVLS